MRAPTVGLLLLLMLGCSASPPPGKGLSELCLTNSDCASSECVNVAGPPDQIHSQCSAFCSGDADCQKIDPRAVCHNLNKCVLGCAKDTDCPPGAACSSRSGGGCYQN
jgi:hypothetical protein